MFSKVKDMGSKERNKMSVADYLEDGADYLMDNCDGECDRCDCVNCDEHPTQKRYHRYSHLQHMVANDYAR